MGSAESKPERMPSKAKTDLAIVAASAVVVYFVAGWHDILEKITQIAHGHERREIDELVTVGVFLACALAIYAWRRRREAEAYRDVIERQNTDLQEALKEIKTLQGIIPICASCKRIRDDAGYWHNLESYVSSHSLAQFSHSICPECVKKLYPDLYKEDE